VEISALRVLSSLGVRHSGTIFETDFVGLITVAVLGFTFWEASGVAIIAAGGDRTYIATVNHP